jgi:hypothetical protein
LAGRTSQRQEQNLQKSLPTQTLGQKENAVKMTRKKQRTANKGYMQ